MIPTGLFVLWALLCTFSFCSAQDQKLMANAKARAEIKEGEERPEARKMSRKQVKRDVNSLQLILDKCVDEGDRVHFASTNDFEEFKEIVQRFYASVFFPRPAA